MDKHQVAMAFETDLRNPGSMKDGEYLRNAVLRRARWLIEVKDSRGSLVSVIEEWLWEELEPKAMLAVDVAYECGLVELESGIRDLRERIASGETFGASYVHWVDRALAKLSR